MSGKEQLQRAAVVAGCCAGAYVLGRFLEVAWVRALVSLRPANLQRFRGDWAIVTGASEGLGLAIAQQLAQHGINLVLVSRSPAKLAAAAKTLPSTVHCSIFPLDLTEAGTVQQLLDATKALPVSILIANAGGGLSDFARYWELKEEELNHVKDLNGTQAYQLMRGILPRLVERGKGAVVAVSSLATVIPGWMVPYAAEKAKLEKVVSGLQQELVGTGVTVQAFRYGGIVTPGLQKLPSATNPTSSSSSSGAAGGSTTSSSSNQPAAGVLKPSWGTPSPEVVARSTVKALGRTGPLFTPHWSHALMEGVLTSIWPYSLQRWVLARVAHTVGGKNAAALPASAAK